VAPAQVNPSGRFEPRPEARPPATWGQWVARSSRRRRSSFAVEQGNQWAVALSPGAASGPGGSGWRLQRWRWLHQRIHRPGFGLVFPRGQALQPGGRRAGDSATALHLPGATTPLFGIGFAGLAAAGPLSGPSRTSSCPCLLWRRSVRAQGRRRRPERIRSPPGSTPQPGAEVVLV